VAARSLDELIAWQLADAFKVEVYALLRRNSAASGDQAFAGQLRAAAASAAMNIGEGFYRYRPKDFARFLSIALASLGEAALWLRDGIQREYFTPAECEPAFLLAKRCRVATLRLRQRLVEKSQAT
jgi:four helix bundle protein